ncbi:MAG TPA: OB-fold domain-containing protein [Streptosporangiaceae bacterium]|jgi:uncharacterized OB-fold protein
MNPGHYEQFLALAARGEGYPLQRCAACGWTAGFPRVCCARCLAEMTWFTGSGTGTITSRAIVWRTHDARYEPYVPIVMAHIELAEGPEVISTIVGPGRLDARIGMAVTRATDGAWSVLPQFRLAG